MNKQVQEAYIVAATRTPVGKAPRGMFRNTRPDDLLAHVLKALLAPLSITPPSTSQSPCILGVPATPTYIPNNPNTSRSLTYSGLRTGQGIRRRLRYAPPGVKAPAGLRGHTSLSPRRVPRGVSSSIPGNSTGRCPCRVHRLFDPMPQFGELVRQHEALEYRVLNPLSEVHTFLGDSPQALAPSGVSVQTS